MNIESKAEFKLSSVRRKGRVKNKKTRSRSKKLLPSLLKSKGDLWFVPVEEVEKEMRSAELEQIEMKFPIPFKNIQETSLSQNSFVQTNSIYDSLGELPDSYGTRRLYLTARDPYWIYCYWDFTDQQLTELRSYAQNGELKLRIYRGKNLTGILHQEISLNAYARNWLFNVGMPNNDFYAEFGYYDFNGTFQVSSRSQTTHTPQDRVSDNVEARFVTIPFQISFGELFELVKKYFRTLEELADVLYRLQMEGFDFPFNYERLIREGEGSDALLGMFGEDLSRRIRMGSEELTVWLQKRMIEQTSSGLFAPSSPGGAFDASKSRDFWFNVNAELIIYGMTERNAQVVFDGKKIPLNPDGSFRFQFTLPDGAYVTPITATSADREETREVQLHFLRSVRNRGDVGMTPQSHNLMHLTKVST
jgi:hypothetical protein